MSSKLSSILVQEGIVPIRTVEEALQRQVIYGGSLGTNLLEMGALEEEQLTLALSRAVGLPPADLSWISSPNRDVLEVFSQALARRYRLIPIRATEQELIGIVEGPLDTSVLEEFGFLLDRKLKLYVLPELRFVQALEKHLGVPIRPRLRNLIKKLDQGKGGERKQDLRSLTEEQRLSSREQELWALSPPSAPRPSWKVTPPPQAPSSSGSVRPKEAEAASPPGERAPREAPQAGAPPVQRVPVAPSAAAIQPGPPPRQSAAPSLSEELLGPIRTAAEPDEVALALGLPGARPSLGFMSAVPQRATGPAPLHLQRAAEQAPPEGDEGQQAPPEEPAPSAPEAPAAVSAASSPEEPAPGAAPSHSPSPAPRSGSDEPPPKGEPDLDAVTLEFRRPRKELPLPTPFPLDLPEPPPAAPREEPLPSLPMLDAFAAEAGGRGADPEPEPALERRSTSQGSRGRSLTRASAALEQQRTRDGLARVAVSFLAQGEHNVYVFAVRGDRLLGYMGRDSDGADVDISHVSLPLPDSGPWRSVLDSRKHECTTQLREEPGLSLYRALTRLAPREILLLPVAIRNRPVMLVVMDRNEHPLSNAAIPTTLVFAQRLARALERLILERKRSGGSKSSRPPSTRSTRSAPRAPAERSGRPRVPQRESGDWELLISGLDSAPELEPSPTEVSAQEEERLDDLVARLSDEGRRFEAREALRAAGEAALESLVEAFPGPILIDRESLVPGRYPPIEGHGPVLELLAELGEIAIPAARDALSSPVISTRFYATLLLGHLLGEEALPELTRRLFDDVAMVRQAAREIVGAHRGSARFDDAKARLLAELVESQSHGPRTHWAIESLSALRLPEAVEPLIASIKHPDHRLARASLRALRELTRRDYGTSLRSWRRWYRKNRDRDRLEWLIDALVQDNRDLQESAAKELHHLTGQRIPLDVNGPKREWKRAQAEWQRWYRTER